MKKKLKIVGIIVGIIALLAATALAYGPASALGVSSSSLAQQLEDSEWGSEGEDKLSDVDCLRASGATYKCMGTMTPDTDGPLSDYLDDETKEEMAGPSPMAYEVTVSFNGGWIADPS